MKTVRRTELPPKREAIIIETGLGRIILSPVSPPIADKTICLELHQEGRDAKEESVTSYDVKFLLLTEKERAALAEGLSHLAPYATKLR